MRRLLMMLVVLAAMFVALPAMAQDAGYEPPEGTGCPEDLSAGTAAVTQAPRPAADCDEEPPGEPPRPVPPPTRDRPPPPLAVTGVSVGNAVTVAIVAGVLLLAGGGLVLVTKRRKPSAS